MENGIEPFDMAMAFQKAEGVNPGLEDVTQMDVEPELVPTMKVLIQKMVVDCVERRVRGDKYAVRAISKRKGGTESKPWEEVVPCDRSTPYGNPHQMQNPSDEERDRVIALFKKDLEADLANNGPLSVFVGEMARKVIKGRVIALECWCAPKKCHCDVLAEAIKQKARELDGTDGGISVSE